MNNKTKNCLICGTQILQLSDNPFFPFCSERCKLIDLGNWGAEKYRIPVSNKDEEEDEKSEN